MRVIAGSAGGIPLRVPACVARPTTDRVRESVFAVLAPRLEGAAVLDLFSGSGALGIEALSRGARSAVFVERDRRAAAVIRENLGKTRLGDRARVVTADVLAFLRRASFQGEGGRRLVSSIDLVLADPPYHQGGGGGRDLAAALLDDAHLPGLVDPEGVFVLETPADAAHGSARSWAVADRRTYGTTAVWWFKPMAGDGTGSGSGSRETARPADL